MALVADKESRLIRPDDVRSFRLAITDKTLDFTCPFETADQVFYLVRFGPAGQIVEGDTEVIAKRLELSHVEVGMDLVAQTSAIP